MTFSTAMSGLNGAQTELATMANNIANVGTNGFKRSRVSFGDIIAASPLQNPARTIGSGTYVKAVSQQFQQGAIETSDSSLDLAISGQGFFTVRAGAGDGETSFTRNGAFGVDAERYVVDGSGRRLQLFPTTTDGSVLTTNLGSTIAARLPLTSGSPKPTSLIKLAVNLPASAIIIPDLPVYTAQNPYVFDRNNPATFNNSTSTTIFDSLGNPVPANVYYVKTAAPSGAQTSHDWTARVFVGST
ncbi:MAG: flagellar hook-basal body complex protein, partial [Sandarakinorhabdus sp.]|nr:flagellar hook-basal body complex protein [Sandarakinorhabdus sp.]